MKAHWIMFVAALIPTIVAAHPGGDAGKHHGAFGPDFVHVGGGLEVWLGAAALAIIGVALGRIWLRSSSNRTRRDKQ